MFRLLSFFQSLYNHMICFGQLGAPGVREWFPWWCERNQLPSTPGRNSSLLPCFFKPRGQQAQIEPAREVVHELPAKAGFNSGLQVHVKFCPVLNCFGLRHSICSYIITWRYVWMFKGFQPFNLCLGVWPQYGWRHIQIAAVLSPVSCNAINGVRDTHFIGKRFLLPSQSCCRLLRFTPPSDGMPPIRDWICTFESMLASGVDLAREPISTNVGTLLYHVHS